MRCVTVSPPIVLHCNCDHNHGVVVLDQVFIMFLELDNYPCTANLLWIVTVSGLKIGLNIGIRWIIEFRSELNSVTMILGLSWLPSKGVYLLLTLIDPRVNLVVIQVNLFWFTLQKIYVGKIYHYNKNNYSSILQVLRLSVIWGPFGGLININLPFNSNYYYFTVCLRIL